MPPTTIHGDNVFVLIAIIISSYLIGSFPTAYYVAKARNRDIFEEGSGNMGGTNTARLLGLGWGVLVAVLDAIKGMAAIVVARLLLPNNPWAATTIAAISAIVGHNWSLFATIIFSRKVKRVVLRGGKGAATAVGTMLMIAPVQTLLGMAAVFGFFIWRTRYVSLAVLTAFAVGLLWLTLLARDGLLPWEYSTYALLLAVLLGWRFRENIQRLRLGTERRLGDRS